MYAAFPPALSLYSSTESVCVRLESVSIRQQQRPSGLIKRASQLQEESLSISVQIRIRDLKIVQEAASTAFQSRLNTKMLACSCKQTAFSLAALSLLGSAAALPQAPSGSSSSSRSGSSSSQRSSSRSGTPTSSIAVPDANPTDYPDNSDVPISAPVDPDIPDYALTYAPIIYLHTNESYFPSSLDVHLS